MKMSINLNMGKVRRDAVNLVKYRGWSMRKVAIRLGVATYVLVNLTEPGYNAINLRALALIGLNSWAINIGAMSHLQGARATTVC